MGGIGAGEWLTIAMIMGLPALGGVLSIVGAVLIARAGRDKPESAAGRTVAIVLLSLFGVVLLFVALGLGACFGMIASEGHF
jgi:hypothetical protein